jgi:hypothetical protein
MNDRERALQVLREARDLLASRLTQRVLENEELVLDDARGDSFLGEIEGIYEQFGLKLNHLNQLLNNLPVEPAAPEPEAARSAPPGPTAEGSTTWSAGMFPVAPAISGPLIVAPPALPAPRVVEELEPVVPSLPLFIAQVHQGTIPAAGRTLAQLFNLNESRGIACAATFAHNWTHDSEFLPKLLTLRTELQQENYNNALVVLAECFGLLGLEALGVLHTLRNRVASGN